ncbi:SCA7, zinc-binding domain-containing protein [Calycina marina]|uniref:SCA7, zinc-binding domain-containing protein n=1 Tax=Calycina marina TaxID=1763456 RepID=A0A9P7Z7Q4_9HELO|nr:SCA7, zinc-binding domain-containing protein [Calycina marina]
MVALGVSGGADDESTIKVSTKKDKPKIKGTIKLKRPAPRHSDAGSWRGDDSVAGEKNKGADTPNTDSAHASPGPVVNQLDDMAKETFATGRPLEDSLDLMACKHCKKGVLKAVAKSHITSCLKQLKEKQRKKKEAKEARERAKKEEARGEKDDDGDTRMESDEDDDGEKKAGELKSTKKGAGKRVDQDDAKKGKKRKADGDADKGPSKKKKKDELKLKAPKPKGPVDVEKQCGVLIKEGVQCARSLTCKSHSMGAKRAVGGRSLPYDMLLTAYQKKNQAKQQKAAIDANAPLEDEDAALGPVDSDEELGAVMHGFSHWNPQPVVKPPILMPIDRVYQKKRLYEQLYQATNGFQDNILRVEGLGAQKLPPGMEGGIAEEDDEPILPGAKRRDPEFNLSLPPQRRPSGNSQQR